MEGNVKVVVKKSSPISSGLAYIFVQTNFEGEACEPRLGASEDISHIKRCFTSLGLTVEHYVNSTAYEILAKLDKARRRPDISKYDCLVVVIISHFIKFGDILCKKECHGELDVINLFTGEKCDGLKGKPKMFFFQVSKYQKRQLTKSNQISVEGGNTSNFVAKFTLPNEVDIFTFRSSYEGGPSHKPENTGSWVIEKLCQQLESLDGSISLLEAITTLLGEIKSNRSGKPSLDPYKILPEMTSSLIQNVYFKNPETTCTSEGPSSYKKEKKMGRFYVFNYNEVWDPHHKEYRSRKGTLKDTEYIKTLFTSLGFDVKIENDLTKDKLFDVLKKAPYFTDDTCVAVAVLTHGIRGLLGTNDNSQINEPDLFKVLAQREDLIGKPKLFFLNVCRGNNISGYFHVEQHEENTQISQPGEGTNVESMISDEEKHHTSVLTDEYNINLKTVGVQNVKTFTTISDNDGNTTVDTVEDLVNISNEDDITAIDTLKSSIDDRDSNCSTGTVSEENRCSTIVSNLEGITTVSNKKIFTALSDVHDVTTTEDFDMSSTINETRKECTTQNLSRNVEAEAVQMLPSSAVICIPPLEYDDIFVFHSTYAYTPAIRDKERGSWFIQNMCEHFEKLTENQEISLLDSVHEVQELIAKKGPEDINGKPHKQMPVIISTLTQRLMLGPRIKPKTHNNPKRTKR